MFGQSKATLRETRAATQGRLTDPVPNLIASAHAPSGDDQTPSENDTVPSFGRESSRGAAVDIAPGQSMPVTGEMPIHADSPPFPNFEDLRADFRANLHKELQWTRLMENTELGDMPTLHSRIDPIFVLGTP